MESIAKSIGKSCGVRLGSNTNPLPDMWQQDADTGGYLVDENGEVIIAVDTIE